MKQYADRVVYEDMYEDEPIDENIISDVEAELRKEVIFCNSKNIYPASAKLLEIYAECGSYQEVANRTKIPYKTVRRHIITLRDKIIKNINDKNLISNAG
jgi:DNA-directed RNA polymerase specialized sigma24 family protein